MTPKELVSVVVPAYNANLYLPMTLNSILSQTYPHLEVIIVDDGSTDDTARICQGYLNRDPRIQYIYQDNQGPAAARNRGIAQATGRFIALLDSDDLMVPTCIALELEAIRKDPLVDIVYTAAHLIDNHGNPIGEVRGQEIDSRNFVINLLFRNVIPCPGSIFAKRECLMKNPYNPDYIHAEDYDLIIRLAHRYRFKYLDLPLISYRRHESNLSNNQQAHRNSELSILRQYSQDHIETLLKHSHLNENEKTLMKGKILFNKELWKEALKILETIPSALSYFYQATCFLKLGEPKKALDCYLKSLELDPQNPACYNNLGVVYSQQGELDKALNCFQKALELKKGYLDPKYNLEHASTGSPLRLTPRELRQNLLPYR